MKILQIVPWLPSNISTTSQSRLGIFELKQISKLVERGNKYKVIAIKWNGQSDYERIGNNIEVYRVPYVFNFPKINYPIPNFLNLGRTIIKLSNDWNPDLIIYSHIEYLTALPSIYLKIKKRVPMIAITGSFPGVAWSSGNKLIDAIGYIHSIIIEKRILKCVNGIQFLNSGLIRYQRQFDIDPNKVFVSTRGVDIGLFKPRSPNQNLKLKLRIKENELVVLYVGRLEPVKGVSYLLESAKMLVSECKFLKFLIVGEGSLRGELERSVASISDNVIFTGFAEDIPALMNISDIFVLPSLSEDMSNVVMEASASGLPVISTNVGAVPEIIIDGRTGILLKDRSIEGLAIALRRLICDPLLRKEMGRLGRRRIEEEYSWEIVGNKMEVFYKKVIDGFK